MKILSIDAWKDNCGWYWNNFYTIGNISKEDFKKLDTNRKILKYLRDEDYLSEASKGKLAIENDDDEYNIVIVARDNGMPLIAIEYGMEV